MRILALVLAGSALISCASRQQPATANQAAAASPTASLQSSSTIACAADGECGVCYRAQSCGEPIAANDPAIETPECHVTPAPFCMPRRGRCEQGHCVAR
ncbi:MAG: hypothetical protein U0269_10665 [Polyangiales bacterium]